MAMVKKNGSQCRGVDLWPGEGSQMKRILENISDSRGGVLVAVVVALACLALVFLFWGGRDAEAILGGSGNVTQNDNPHNLAAGSTGIKATVEDRICVFCHTPHNALTDASLINAPLWNHELSSASYTTWTPQLTNTPPDNPNVGYVNVLTTQPSQLDGSSRMCMGCHDGTIGIGNVVSGADITMDTADACLDADGSLKVDAACPQTIGTDLTTKHIVSVPMNDTLIANSATACDGSQTSKLSYPWVGASSLEDTVFLRPTATLYGTTKGVSSGFPNGKYKNGYNYGVQCSTCHDPHFWSSSSGSVGYKFLVTADTNNLCKSCHYPC